MNSITVFQTPNISASSNSPIPPPVPKEFDRLLRKHAGETGLPVIVDFYSDGCGPCRQIAPAYKRLAKEIGQDRAVFVKVDMNNPQTQELSQRYQVRSMPTFAFFYGGKKVSTFAGAGEQQLRQNTQQVVRQSDLENVVLRRKTLDAYYAEKDAEKNSDDIDKVYSKCAGMTKVNPTKECVGQAATNLVRGLKKKYGNGPKTEPRFTDDDRKPSDQAKNQDKAKSKTEPSSSSEKPNLHLASIEDLLAEIEKRQDEEMDRMADEGEDDDAEFANAWLPGDFPEKVAIVGGGPAGIAAAIYAARAGLEPVIVAPPMGGQLQGKGVDVENYPGLANVTGPGVIAAMRAQAVQFGTRFESELVTEIDVSSRPFRVRTNSSVIDTHTIIVATGAESNWLDIPGEYEMRGGGVSSCATCDGAAFSGLDVVVVGGGDTAMEDALVLARTSRSVTVVHRRDTFRASKVMAQRVLEHEKIQVRWNSTLEKILGEFIDSQGAGGSDSTEDLDTPRQKIVTGAVIKDKVTGDTETIAVGAVFVAIGHTPATSFLKNIVEFDEEHAGYVSTIGRSTRTSLPGIFVAGDVSDAVYRQAITSAGSGAAAALDAERYLSEEGLGNEAAMFEAELLAELMADEDPTASQRESFNAYEDAGGRMKGMKESVGAEL